MRKMVERKKPRQPKEVLRIGDAVIRSKFPIHQVSEHAYSIEDGHWTWLRRVLPKSYSEMLEARKITGKYLFFSEDRNALIKIAIEELEKNGFYEAKVNNVGKNIGPEYVLCLYYKDDSRRQELARKYANSIGIKYRYWKSDQDTLSGKYSQEFLGKLTLEERKEFARES